MAAQEYYNPDFTAPQSPYPPQSSQQGPPPPYAPFPQPQYGAQQPSNQSYQQNQQEGKYHHTQGYPQGAMGQQQQQQQPPLTQRPYYPSQGQHTTQIPPYAYQQQPQQQHSQQYMPPRPAEMDSLQPNVAGHYGSSPQRYSPSPQLRPQSASPYPVYPGSSPQRRHRSHSRQRSRDRSRSHDRSRSGDHRARRNSANKSRSAFDTFVGAGGGAIIGDAIFPGLGTVGGALLGGYGGHVVAKDKQRDANDLRRREEHAHRKHRSRDMDYSDSDSDRDGRRRH